MNYIKKLHWLLVPFLVTSCFFQTEDDFQEELAEETAMLQQEENAMSPLLGTWLVVSVNQNSETTVTSSSSSTTYSTTAVGSDLNHTITFTDEPNEAVGEGLYSLEMTFTETDDNSSTSSTYFSAGHILLGSFATWNYEGDTLSLDLGGKIVNAEVLNLTTTELLIEISSQDTQTLNGVTTVTSDSIIYEFLK